MSQDTAKEDLELFHLFQEAAYYDNSDTVIAVNLRAQLPRDYKPDGHDYYLELHYEGDAYKLAYQDEEDAPIFPGPGEQLYTVYATKHEPGKKRVVVEREDANLTQKTSRSTGRK